MNTIKKQKIRSSAINISKEDEENQQREAEERLEAEQAERAAEDARLRELYPLPEDEQEYGDTQYEGYNASENDQTENTDENEILSKEEKHFDK